MSQLKDKVFSWFPSGEDSVRDQGVEEHRRLARALWLR
jgi:hypothetical protein